MKKVSLLVLLSIMTAPVFAEENTNIENKTSDITAEHADAKKSMESEHKFMHGFQIGAGISATSGLNGFIGYTNKDFNSFWAKRFGIRLDFATTKPIKSLINKGIDSVTNDGIDISDSLTITDINIDAKHYAALVDFYPFGNTWLLGAWRITGGYAFGDMNMSADIAGEFDGPSGRYEFELAGQHYSYTGNSIHGTAELNWDYRGPYLGTGFDFGLFAGFKIYLDAGVVFTNRAAEISLDIPFENLQKLEGNTWTPVDSDALKNEVNNYKEKALADAQSELNDFKFYPMIKMGFMYRF